ncbi:MAG TPA: glycosyltransferase family 2 protein [Syntrophomonadaceae bacterium]|nr:glycosyltransferase family 2 protein [Syntrophomonadaceae bacterium]
MPTVTVVIPAYNETDRIVDTIKAVKKINNIDEIIVMNDGSTDDTSDKAKAEGVTVVDLNPNRGKGGAMNAALPYIKTDVVAFLDGDLGAAAGEAGKIIKPVVEGIADLCIASFPPPKKKGGFGIVKGTAAWAIRKVGKIEATAPLSGQRAMTIEVLRTVTPFHEGYGVELGMSINALLHGFRLMEVPTTMTHKETGRDLKGFIHRGRQFIDVVRVIRRETRGRKY